MIADIFLTVCVVIGVVSAILLAVLLVACCIVLILCCVSAVYGIGRNVKNDIKSKNNYETHKCE